MVFNSNISYVTTSTNIDVNYSDYFIDASLGDTMTTLPLITSDGTNISLIRLDSTSNMVSVVPTTPNLMYQGLNSISSYNISVGGILRAQSYDNNWYLSSINQLGQTGYTGPTGQTGPQGIIDFSVTGGTGIFVNNNDPNNLIINNTGVTSVTGGTGIFATNGTGSVIINNTGVTNATGGTGIFVTNGTGTITINNTGVTNATGGTGIFVTNGTGSVIINNTGVTNATGGTGISVTNGTGTITINNTGVTNATGGTGISVTNGTGSIIITRPTIMGFMVNAGGKTVAIGSGIQWNTNQVTGTFNTAGFVNNANSWTVPVTGIWHMEFNTLFNVVAAVVTVNFNLNGLLLCKGQGIEVTTSSFTNAQASVTCFLNVGDVVNVVPTSASISTITTSATAAFTWWSAYLVQ